MRALSDDTEALQTRIDLIKNAQNEILIEYFEVAQDKLSIIGLGLLEEAAARGVKVKIIVDNRYSDLTRAQFAAIQGSLAAVGRESNFQIKVFNPLTNPFKLFDQTYRNHDKLFVVDGKFGIIGGRNVSGSYFGRAADGHADYVDLDVLAYGSEIRDDKVIGGRTHLSPRNYFLTLWNENPMVRDWSLYEYAAEKINGFCGLNERAEQCEQQQAGSRRIVAKARLEMTTLLKSFNDNVGEPMKETYGLTARRHTEAKIRTGMYNVDMLFMYNDPKEVMSQIRLKLGIQLSYLLGVQKPRQITIVTPYLFPPKGTLDLFAELKSKYGTKIKIISNSLNSTDSTLVHAGYELVKPILLDMQTEIFEFSGPLNVEKQPTLLHAKMMILDEESNSPSILIGSFNLDYRSAMINREVGVVISGQQTKSLAKDMLKRVREIEAMSNRADYSDRLNLSATPEKQEQLQKDKYSPILKFFYEHI
ncbi:hypothetical protein BH10BDE1_BH10BDE1_09270 [soil metagenome]